MLLLFLRALFGMTLRRSLNQHAKDKERRKTPLEVMQARRRRQCRRNCRRFAPRLPQPHLAAQRARRRPASCRPSSRSCAWSARRRRLTTACGGPSLHWRPPELRRRPWRSSGASVQRAPRFHRHTDTICQHPAGCRPCCCDLCSACRRSSTTPRAGCGQRCWPARPRQHLRLLRCRN